MPKSRKRKPGRARRHPTSTPSAGRVAAKLGADCDELRPWKATMIEADAAEARGDAAEALRLMRDRPLGPDGKPFWRPWRLRRLAQVVALEPLLPGWAYSRWLLEQARQALTEPSRGRTFRAIQIAQTCQSHDPGPAVDETDAMCRVMDRDWVFRQVFLYELGGLEEHLRSAAPALVARADRIRGWARAPMGGYQLIGHEPSSVTWRDLSSDATFTVANNGCGALVVPGEHVLGRRVPVKEGSMFESVPLNVPQLVAERVARTPTDWIEAVAAAVADGEPIRTGAHQFDLLSDVHPIVWMSGVLSGWMPVTDGAAPAAGLAHGVLDLAVRFIDEPTLDPDELDPWPCLAAAILEPDVAPAIAAFTKPDNEGLLRRLAELLAEPASSVCRVLAEGARDAA